MAKTDNMPHKRVNAQEYDNKEHEFPDIPPTTLSPEDLARIFSDRNGPEIPTMNVNQLNEQFDMGMPTTYEHHGPSLPDEGRTRDDDDRLPKLPDTKPGVPDTYLDITLPDDVEFGKEDKEEFSHGIEM